MEMETCGAHTVEKTLFSLLPKYGDERLFFARPVLIPDDAMVLENLSVNLSER